VAPTPQGRREREVLSAALTAQDAFVERTYGKVTWRLLPFIGICYLVAYIDRVNVGFAKLQMLSDLSLSEAAYGLGAGMFFIGYFIFEVPSNLILHRVGANVDRAHHDHVGHHLRDDGVHRSYRRPYRSQQRDGLLHSSVSLGRG
jgi:hypothetical protein